MTGLEHYLSIFTKAVFIENIVLAYFLGLCSFLAISKKIDASVGIGMAVIVVLTITAPINWVLWEFLLAKGYEVHGIKRRSSSFNASRIEHIYQDPHVNDQKFFLHYGDLTDSTNLIRIIQQV